MTHRAFNSTILLGLIASAFYMFPGTDIREIKIVSAVFFAFAIGSFGAYFGFRPIKNYWVLALITFIPCSVYLSAQTDMQMNGVPMEHFWSWYAFVKVLAFSLMFFAIASYSFEKIDVERILRVICLCGTLTAGYVVLQYFSLDQLFENVSGEASGRVAGFIGNPTLTAPFTAMIVPICLFRKNYWQASLCALGSILPNSQIAWFALIVGVSAYFAMRGPTWFFGILSGLVLASIMFFAITARLDGFKTTFNDHERLRHWNRIVHTLNKPMVEGDKKSYPLTGKGIGSFKYIYRAQNADIGSPNRFFQAHNEYLQFVNECGLIGGFLMVMAIIKTIKDNISWRKIMTFGECAYKRSLLASFLVMVFTAFGTFIWQIGTTAFYTVVVCGLLYNDSASEHMA